MNISFERTANSTVLIDQDGIKFGLPATMYVIPSRWYDTQLNDENVIEISNGNNFSFRFDWRDVTYPVVSDRNELITVLITDFFFKLDGTGGGGGGDVFKLAWSYRTSTDASGITISRDLTDGTDSTNISPFVIPINSRLKFISAHADSATSTASSCLIDVLRNNISISTLTLSSPSYKAVSGVLAISFSDLDEVRVRIKSIAGGVISKPSVDIYFQEI